MKLAMNLLLFISMIKPGFSLDLKIWYNIYEVNCISKNSLFTDEEACYNWRRAMTANNLKRVLCKKNILYTDDLKQKKTLITPVSDFECFPTELTYNNIKTYVSYSMKNDKNKDKNVLNVKIDHKGYTKNQMIAYLILFCIIIMIVCSSTSTASNDNDNDFTNGFIIGSMWSSDSSWVCENDVGGWGVCEKED